MNASVCIEQKGIIQSINNHLIKIKIDRESACGNCSTRGICSLAESSGRIVEVSDESGTFVTGELVQVRISRSMGNKAILLGYFLPLVLFICSLVLFTHLSFPEWLSGCMALALLAPYYFVLFLMRDRIKRTFTFEIHKI